MKDDFDGKLPESIDPTLQNEALLHLRDGAWHKMAELAEWLASRIPPELAIRRAVAQNGSKELQRQDKESAGRALLLQDLVATLRRRRLLTIRTGEGGDEVQVRPLADPQFRIEPEFEHLLPRSADEVAKLEELLLKEECRDALVVWKERKVLIDGHTRFRLLSLLGKEYKIVEKSFPDREAVVAWLYDSHYGRRNFSPEMKSYVRGKHLLSADLKRGGDRKGPMSKSSTLITARSIAEQYHVDRTTLYNDARFADAVDKIAAICGDEVRQKVLSRLVKWTRKDMVRLAKMEAAAIQEILRKALASGKRPVHKKRETNRTNIRFPKNRPSAQVIFLKRLIGVKGLTRLGHAIALALKKERAHGANA